MRVCGYQLRCLNREQDCFECTHQAEDKNEGCSRDALNVLTKNEEAVKEAKSA